MTVELSDYEKLRAQNIERNNARLRALGLISALEQSRSNRAAWGVVEDDDPNNNERFQGQKSITRKRKHRVTVQGSRKSLRLQGISAATRPNENQDGCSSHEQQPKRKRQRHDAEVNDNNGKENRTATYDHCLMRVRTMSHKALANRVKAMERAAGKHCVAKMAIFKRCCQDQGLPDLAQQASEALERLQALK